MFLSRLVLNLGEKQVRFDLARPYEMHRTLWKAFPDGNPGRILYRVDCDSRTSQSTVLVQSDLEPVWFRLPDGYLRAKAECKQLTLSISSGQHLRFRLRANPTKRLGNSAADPKLVGKRVGLLSEVEQIRWLLRKADEGGFSIPGQWIEGQDPNTGQLVQYPNFRVDAVPEGTHRGIKDRDSAHLAVRFEGVLVVTDPVRFRETVFAGVGSGKGFGFGLLSIASA